MTPILFYYVTAFALFVVYKGLVCEIFHIIHF